jgi:hypothetical protein
VANTQSMQFFLRTAKSEEEILELLSTAMGFPVESTDLEVPDAIGFAQITEYSEGFEQGILVTWPANLERKIELDIVARAVAVGFQVKVLLEVGEDDWILANPDGILNSTNIIYLDDGIEVRVPGTPAEE